VQVAEAEVQGRLHSLAENDAGLFATDQIVYMELYG
jgi:hypothetical protein